MKKKNMILTVVLSIVLVLMITIGASYAYFTATMLGEDTTTITVKGGKMLITYAGGDEIEIYNVLPDENPIATKTFTVTGYNNTSIYMGYKISLVVESNTFSDVALKYKLISTNTDNNGNVAKSITDLTDIPTGTNTITLGYGIFDVPTDGNKTHTYNLELYFPNQGYDQNIEQQKQINAYVAVEDYIPTLYESIMAQGGGATAIEAKGDPDFSKIAVSQATYDALPETATLPDASKETAIVENGLYAAEDEYGTSYYYRGEKTELNNNLIWGGFQWKIVRINGDDSIRLIYNGTKAQFNAGKTINVIGEDTQIEGTHAWNEIINDAKYVGYMYGGANGSASSQRFGTTSKSATFNQTNTNIKTILDNWYKTNIIDKGFGPQVADNLFCNDRQLISEVSETSTGGGYGTSHTDYAASYRKTTSKIPTLKCGLQNDQFTTSAGAEIGNGALTYPVGLLTVDELSMAGLGKSNTINYLYTNQSWWTFSPEQNHWSHGAWLFHLQASGSPATTRGSNSHGARPSVSLISTIKVAGSGSATDPFIAL